jgi:hypothetical protein
VTGNGLAHGDSAGDRPEIDTSVPTVARIYDYLLGGTENFAVDRAAAERAYAAWPGGIEAVRADVRAHRALLGRVIRYLAADAGIRQFLDIGTGIPKENNTHEVAQRVAPDSKIVYVDHDRCKLGCVHAGRRGPPSAHRTCPVRSQLSGLVLVRQDRVDDRVPPSSTGE